MLESWQPIETATGRATVLVTDGKHNIAIAHIVTAAWTQYICGTAMLFQPRLCFQPTHWMPLPQPPEAL
jgi:hypothetical protein